jgi:hypothetical protein
VGGVTDAALLIPVLCRPQRVAPLLESISEATPEPHRVVFAASDGPTIAELDRLGQEYLRDDHLRPEEQSWGRRINRLFAYTDEPFVFLGADDLLFWPDWLSEALRVMARVDGVVMCADLLNPRGTSPLVSRRYILEEGGTVDDTGLVIHEGYRHNWCTPAETPIWMADLSFRKIGDVEVGDAVIGWTRRTWDLGRAALLGRRDMKARSLRSMNRLCVSEVLHVSRRRAPVVDLQMASGRRLRCTPDHFWLNAAYSPSSKSSEWITPAKGRHLLRVIDTPPQVPQEHLRLAGWLGGIYDGEGSRAYVASQCRVRNPEVYAAIEQALDVLGIPHTLPETGRTVRLFCLVGGRQGYLNFLAIAQPIKRQYLVDRIMGSSRFGRRDTVVAVSAPVDAEVFSLTTSTGNYVAWGFASKNCDAELVAVAKARGRYAYAAGAVVEHLHPQNGKSVFDSTYLLGYQSEARDHALFDSRRHLWEAASISTS